MLGVVELQIGNARPVADLAPQSVSLRISHSDYVGWICEVFHRRLIFGHRLQQPIEYLDSRLCQRYLAAAGLAPAARPFAATAFDSGHTYDAPFPEIVYGAESQDLPRTHSRFQGEQEARTNAGRLCYQLDVLSHTGSGRDHFPLLHG